MERFNNYYNNLDDEIKRYFSILGDIPYFMYKYLVTDEMLRLNDIGYFCGMDYASFDMYNFKCYVSRYTHSITTAIMTYRFTVNKALTIKALLHDIGTPIFSHVIDYMNKDYLIQESTEKESFNIINNSSIKELLGYDNIDIDFILSKNEDVVDNKGPKLCADRLDGIFLNSLFWAKNISLKEVEMIYKDICVGKNEYGNDELCVNNEVIAMLVNILSINIGYLQTSKEDMFCMMLLSDIVKYMINNKYINYSDLYCLKEKDFFELVKNYSIDDSKLDGMYTCFKNLNRVDDVVKIKVKKRYVDPLVDNKRLSSINMSVKNKINSFLDS